MDPPQHDRFKLLVSRGFTPRNAPLLGPRIEELAREIIDDVIEAGSCDLVKDIAGRLPSGLIAELMGIPRSDGERLYELTEIMHTQDSSEEFRAKQMGAIGEMLGYAQSVAERKRAEPGNDIATMLVEGGKDASMQVAGANGIGRRYELRVDGEEDANGKTTGTVHLRVVRVTPRGEHELGNDSVRIDQIGTPVAWKPAKPVRNFCSANFTESM
jgi:hypothetical protein